MVKYLSYLSKLKGKLKSTAFYDAYSQFLALKHYNWLIVLFDVLFVLSIYTILFLAGLFFNANTLLALAQFLRGITNYLIIFSMLIYVALLILSLTFFRYSIMDIIKNKLKTKLDLKRLLKLYLLNLLIFIVFFTFLMVIMNVLSYTLRADFFPYFRDIITISTAIVFYLVYNLSATEFFVNKKSSNFSTIILLKSVFRAIFSKKLWKLMPLFLTFLVFISFYVILYFVTSTIAAVTIFRDPILYIKYYPFYLTVLAWIAYVFIYFWIYFNRFYITTLIKRAK